jgi:hypothetical protein
LFINTLNLSSTCTSSRASCALQVLGSWSPAEGQPAAPRTRPHEDILDLHTTAHSTRSSATWTNCRACCVLQVLGSWSPAEGQPAAPRTRPHEDIPDLPAVLAAAAASQQQSQVVYLVDRPGAKQVRARFDVSCPVSLAIFPAVLLHVVHVHAPRLPICRCLHGSMGRPAS